MRKKRKKKKKTKNQKKTKKTAKKEKKETRKRRKTGEKRSKKEKKKLTIVVYFFRGHVGTSGVFSLLPIMLCNTKLNSSGGSWQCCAQCGVFPTSLPSSVMCYDAQHRLELSPVPCVRGGASGSLPNTLLNYLDSSFPLRAAPVSGCGEASDRNTCEEPLCPADSLTDTPSVHKSHVRSVRSPRVVRKVSG